MEVVIPLGFIGIIFTVTYFFAKRNMEQIEQSFGQLAKRLNVELILPNSRWGWFMGEFPRIEGEINGLPFVSYMYTKGSGKNKRTYTTFVFQLEKNLMDTLQLYKEGFWAKVGKTFGKQDIQLGDKAFDEAYIIRSNREAFAHELLNREIRQAFLRKFPKLRGEFKLVHGRFEYHALVTLNTQIQCDEWLKTIKVGQQLVEKIEDLA